MNVKSTKHNSKTQTNWVKLNQEDDSDIDYSDSPATDTKFWEDAEVLMPIHKAPISLRLDEDIIKYFRDQGFGYQAKTNAILKAYMKVHPHDSKRTQS